MKRFAVMLCHTKDCCPVLTVANNIATITDDFGGSVKLSLEELRELQLALEGFFQFGGEEENSSQTELDFTGAYV